MPSKDPFSTSLDVLGRQAIRSADQIARLSPEHRTLLRGVGFEPDVDGPQLGADGAAGVAAYARSGAAQSSLNAAYDVAKHHAKQVQAWTQVVRRHLKVVLDEPMEPARAHRLRAAYAGLHLPHPTVVGAARVVDDVLPALRADAPPALHARIDAGERLAAPLREAVQAIDAAEREALNATDDAQRRRIDLRVRLRELRRRWSIPPEGALPRLDLTDVQSVLGVRRPRKPKPGPTPPPVAPPGPDNDDDDDDTCGS